MFLRSSRTLSRASRCAPRAGFGSKSRTMFLPSSATNANLAPSGARRRGSSSCMSRRALNWSAGATARTVFVAARAGHTCRSSAAASRDARLLILLGLPWPALKCSQTQSRPANFLGSCVFQAETSASKSRERRRPRPRPRDRCDWGFTARCGPWGFSARCGPSPSFENARSGGVGPGSLSPEDRFKSQA